MQIQAVLLTLLIPLLPYVLWKCYNKGKKEGKGAAVFRYLIYLMIVAFLSAILLALFSDEDTSFWEKMDRSAGFALKYVFLLTGSALLVAFAEWSYLRKKFVIRVEWEQFGRWKPVVFSRKYICPVLPYALALLIVGLNVSLMFDNVVWGDEAFSTGTARANLYGILQIMYFWDNHPPLYYYWLKLFCELFGFTVPVCHLASIVPFAAGILLALFWFRKRYGNLPAAFFIVISGLGVSCLEYNQEIRMYALAFFCVAACFYCSARVIGSGKKSAWVGMVLWGLAGAYSHYYALVTAGLILFFTGAAVWVRKRGKTWLKGAGAILAFILGYSPWLFFLATAIRNVSHNWWVSDILGMDSVLDMVLGSGAMVKVVAPLLAVTSVFILLADSGVLRMERRPEEVLLEVHTPNMKQWKDETFSIAVGLLTIAGTIAFGYFLCLVMTPVLVARYMYPLSAVTLCLLILCSSRALALLKDLGKRMGLLHLEGFGKAMLAFLLCILLVMGMGNYQRYSAQVKEQDEKTQKTLDIIGTPDPDVKMVTNGVKHLGWTVLSHYYRDHEIVNDDYTMAGADRFWYFSPHELDRGVLDELKKSGVSVTVYGENQIAVYPFYLYFFEQ
ncbi:MAG: glycosyltransferase family 39 protein [Lachnospiraceae bacterium]|nr:glycosyltransferase family 39 protein [Butyrivibrio sp.]MCM1344928.1 glycosyltransferase family 39 protein [Muribaculaceae bacterium]MCM1412078.1 glycosyltransferase family 39 protein [Lachnospiraceae bacterium]